jgi:condensin complex subunit 1
MGDLRFDLGETLTAYLDDPLSILTPEAHPGLLDCENDTEAFTSGAIHGALDGIIDAIAESPEAVLQPSNLQTLEFLLKYVFTSDHENAILRERRSTSSEF